MQIMMIGNNSENQVKNKKVLGTNFSVNGVCEINNHQDDLEMTMNNLNHKF